MRQASVLSSPAGSTICELRCTMQHAAQCTTVDLKTSNIIIVPASRGRPGPGRVNGQRRSPGSELKPQTERERTTQTCFLREQCGRLKQYGGC
jgi:hypothetical protein